MITEEKIKHLEIIQGVINRLANNSFLIKGWMITVSLAGFSLFINQKEMPLLVIISFIVILFWVLDACYLRQERLFRRLYSKCVEENTIKPFDMDVSKYSKEISSLVWTMFSYPTLLFYIPIFIASIILYFIYG